MEKHIFLLCTVTVTHLCTCYTLKQHLHASIVRSFGELNFLQMRPNPLTVLLCCISFSFPWLPMLGNRCEKLWSKSVALTLHFWTFAYFWLALLFLCAGLPFTFPCSFLRVFPLHSLSCPWSRSGRQDNDVFYDFTLLISWFLPPCLCSSTHLCFAPG